jgi:formyl-CoA transferase
MSSSMPGAETSPLSVGGPLNDLRVLEMGQLLAGPFCGQLYGDFGAEVIKIEQPKVGDPMREWGREKPHGLSLWWPVVGRNKKSVTLNVRESEGQDIVRALVERSDILIENFRPGTMEKWGLGYEELARINPRLIMIRVSGFGQTGPRSGEAGFVRRHVPGFPSATPWQPLSRRSAASWPCMR